MKKNLKNKFCGILIILTGLLLVALSGWLGSKVWGTALLYTDAVIGKIAAYYWIILILALIVIIVGCLVFRKKAVVLEKTEDETLTDTKAETEVETAVKKESEKTTEKVSEAKPEKKTEVKPEEKPEEKTKDKCPKCGAQIKEGMKFCTACGEKL